MSEPTNKKLYERVKAEIYKKYPQHSADRSGLLVKEQKSQGGKYSGKENNNSGLNRWFREDWKNQIGESGYKYKSDVYRPTTEIDKHKTPATFTELSKKEIARARREKASTGRVEKFKQTK